MDRSKQIVDNRVNILLGRALAGSN